MPRLAVLGSWWAGGCPQAPRARELVVVKAWAQTQGMPYLAVYPTLPDRQVPCLRLDSLAETIPAIRL